MQTVTADQGWLILVLWDACSESALLIDVCGLVFLEVLTQEEMSAHRRLLWCSKLDTFSYMLGDGASFGVKTSASAVLMPKRT